ncbi:MAG: hypothetical protein IRZ16_10275 [Myxococcaceae bacterium]|nr:hypothetical protein [Myxococcaceae bacterium]
MRRLEISNSAYRVEFAPSVKPLLAAFSRELSARINGELYALAELAELAPIPLLGSLIGPHDAPPLHLTVEEWIITYVIDRRGRLIRVVALEPT